MAGSVAVWNVAVAPPKFLRLLTQKDRPIVDPVERFVQHIRFSDDSKKIFAMDRQMLHVWNWLEAPEASAGWALEQPGYFLTRDRLMQLPEKPRTASQVFTYDGKGLRRLHRADARMPWSGWPFLTPNGRYAVCGDPDTLDILVLDLEKPGSQVVDRIPPGWFSADNPTTAERGNGFSFAGAGMTLDRSVIIQVHSKVENSRTVWQGIAFFPRTQAKAKEFGLDLAKQTHLFLPLAKPLSWPANTVASPDGRWLAICDVGLPPRIWEVATLGPALLAETGIRKK